MEHKGIRDTLLTFHKYVHALRIHRLSWTDIYSVEERLVKGLRFEGDASAFVNVSGSIGQVLQDFYAILPQYTGRLMLQELAVVVSAAKAAGVGGGESGIELQAHRSRAHVPILCAPCCTTGGTSSAGRFWGISKMLWSQDTRRSSSVTV